MLFFQNICTLNTRLDGNIKSKSSNNTYLNIVKIFNKLFKIMNMIKMQNLGVISTWKNRHFKFTELFNVSCHKGVMYTSRRTLGKQDWVKTEYQTQVRSLSTS